MYRLFATISISSLYFFKICLALICPLRQICLPDNQSTMMLQEQSTTLTELLRATAAKRKFEAASYGMKLKEDSTQLLTAQEMQDTTVADLAVKEVTLVRLVDLITSGKKSKADAMSLLAAAAATSSAAAASSSAPGADQVFLQVHLPDGGQTMLKVAESMSMGELIFYIAEKRGLDVGSIALADNSSGRKLISMKGGWP